MYFKKNYAICTIKKKKCVNCKKLLSKYILDSEFKIIIFFFQLINYYLDYYVWYLLSIQTNFSSQKWKIEESIKKLNNSHHHQVIFDIKYHYKLNSIKYFWYYIK